MHKRVFVFVVILFTSFVLGCGGTSGTSKQSRIFKKNLGHCMRPDFFEVVDKIVFLKYRYLEGSNRRDMTTRIEIYTEWKSRSPFPDEIAIGIVAVDSKITVSAKINSGQTRSITTGEADYTAYLQAENRVKYIGKEENWEPGPITKDAKRYFNDIVFDMMQDFKAPY